MIDLATLDELHTEIMSRTPSGREGAFAYLFATPRANASSLTRKAASLSGLLGVSNAPPFPGYDGIGAWKRYLVEEDVDPGRIVPVPLTFDSHNTLTEAVSFVQQARAQKITEALVVATPFHITRAYMTTVGAIRLLGVDLRVHPVPGCDLPWGEKAAHSQGTLVAPRSSLVFHEATRIVRYHAQGDLPDPGIVLEHMRKAA